MSAEKEKRKKKERERERKRAPSNDASGFKCDILLRRTLGALTSRCRSGCLRLCMSSSTLAKSFRILRDDLSGRGSFNEYRKDPGRSGRLAQHGCVMIRVIKHTKLSMRHVIHYNHHRIQANGKYIHRTRMMYRIHHDHFFSKITE